MDSKIICYAQDKDLIISEDCLRLLNLNNYKKILDKLSDDKKIFVSPEDIRKVIGSFNHTTEETQTTGKNYRILDGLDVTGKKLSQGTVEDFLSLFLDKYNTLSEIIKKRIDFSHQTITDAKREIKGKEVHIIGMVLDKRTTKNGNLLLTVDDPTGKVNIVIMEEKEESKKEKDQIEPKEILMDNIVGFKCSVLSKEIFIAKEMIYADVPYQNRQLQTKDDSYVVILGDTHVGSKLFREDEFNGFIEWLNAFNVSREDKEIIEKIRYVIIAGDLVDGIGIYPKQYNELAITDIFEQYRVFEEYILRIPENIEVFLTPGNHDAVRVSDPQPAISEKFLPRLCEKENVHIIGSPSWIDLEGLLFLIYHGVSLHGIFGKIKDLKMDRPDLAQKELLKRRDLMPQFGEKQTFIPIEKNFLTIKEIPDVFICGHIHHHAYSKYKSCHLISTSCWQSITSFQIEMGHTPTVSKAILFNLKNQKLCIKDFEKPENKIECK